MPDIMSIGLGGGSIVRQQQDGSVTVGPDSVGYKITDEALTFGGNIITATDIAVRLGLSDVGDPQLTKQISLKFAQAALQTISDMIAVAIDKMKTSADPATVILVGGGAIIAPHRLEGVGKLVRDPLGGVANAIGASISQVSGEYGRIYPYNQIPRDKAMADAKEKATAAAIESGADETTIEVVEVDEVPLAYHPENANRVKIKVVGNLAK